MDGSRCSAHHGSSGVLHYVLHRSPDPWPRRSMPGRRAGKRTPRPPTFDVDSGIVRRCSDPDRGGLKGIGAIRLTDAGAGICRWLNRPVGDHSAGQSGFFGTRNKCRASGPHRPTVATDVVGELARRAWQHSAHCVHPGRATQWAASIPFPTIAGQGQPEQLAGSGPGNRGATIRGNVRSSSGHSRYRQGHSARHQFVLRADARSQTRRRMGGKQRA